MSQIRITNWKGDTVHKKKRGFRTKKGSARVGKRFLNQSSASLEMKFSDFIDIYFRDMEQRLKQTTIANKRFMVDLKIIPYFGKMPLDEIKPTDIRAWQNSLTSYRDESGTTYSPTYLKAIQNHITAIFNYAVKYYNLKENPCHKAESMGKNTLMKCCFGHRTNLRNLSKPFRTKRYRMQYL